MANKIMKTLTIGENTYEIVDESARNSIESINASLENFSPSGGSTPSSTAVSAKKLETARTITTNLDSTSSEPFDGTKDVSLGVTGVLPIVNGGTGATNASEARIALGITPENVGALALTGGVINGTFAVQRSNNYPSINFNDTEGNRVGCLQFNSATHKGYVAIDSTDSEFNEKYNFPSVNSGLTANQSYDILTTKSLVAIDQGGTGAANAREASVNLLNDNTLNTITTPTSDYNGIFYTTMPDEAAGTGDITSGTLLHIQSSTNRGFQIAAQAYGSTIKWRGVHSGSTSDAGVSGYKTWYTLYHSGNKPTPSDIGAAPTSHASSATTYGVSSASDYGHSMASSTTPKNLATSAAVGSETTKFARGDHVHALPALTDCTGTLTVAKGGTGATTLASNAIITGNGTSAVKTVATKSGALYATSANGAAVFGTLPVAQGGTGSTTAANARKSLGVPTFTYTSSTKTLALTTT